MDSASTVARVLVLTDTGLRVEIFHIKAWNFQLYPKYLPGQATPVPAKQSTMKVLA